MFDRLNFWSIHFRNQLGSSRQSNYIKDFPNIPQLKKKQHSDTCSIFWPRSYLYRTGFTKNSTKSAGLLISLSYKNGIFKAHFAVKLRARSFVGLRRSVLQHAAKIPLCCCKSYTKIQSHNRPLPCQKCKQYSILTLCGHSTILVSESVPERPSSHCQ